MVIYTQAGVPRVRERGFSDMDRNVQYSDDGQRNYATLRCGDMYDRDGVGMFA